MSPRKGSGKPSDGKSSPARIDDFLVRNYEARQHILETIASHQAGGLTVEDVHELALDVQGQGAPAIQATLDCLFDEDANVRRTALMVLGGIDDPVLGEKIQALLQRPDLPEPVRASLLAVEALHEDALAMDGPALSPPLGLSLDSLLGLAESFWGELEMEELAMMWLENFGDERPEDRFKLLDVLMKTAHPKMLGVARVEIALGEVKILQFLAEKLGEFHSAFAGTLLDTLLVHPDLVVRTLAEQSLNRLNERAKTGASEPAAPARFYAAHLVSEERSGHYSLVYAVKLSTGAIKFFVTLLDRLDRGVIDCWGNARSTAEEFDEMLNTIGSDFLTMRQTRITKATALTYLDKAIALNIRRAYSLPIDLSVWMHLFENQRFRPDPDVPEFGAHCSRCHKPIRTGTRSQPFVLNRLVVCPKCARKKSACPTCKGKISLLECLVTPEDSGDGLQLRCPHCFEPAGQETR